MNAPVEPAINDAEQEKIFSAVLDAARSRGQFEIAGLGAALVEELRDIKRLSACQPAGMSSAD